MKKVRTLLSEKEMEKRKISGFNLVGDILQSEKYVKRPRLKDWKLNYVNQKSD